MEVLARSSDSRFTGGFEAGASINNIGNVAFVGRASTSQDSESVYLFKNTGSTRISLTRRFSQFYRLNDSDKVVAQDQGSGGLSIKTFVRQWASGEITKVAEAGIAETLNSVPLIDPITLLPRLEWYVAITNLAYDVVYGPSSNNRGDVTFAATGGTSGKLYTDLVVKPATGNAQILMKWPASNVPIRPSVADDGRLAVRAGPGEPILLFIPDLAGGYVIHEVASLEKGFGALGDPSISDDGSMVAFWGILTSSGARTISDQQPGYAPLNPGPGIFIAHRSNFRQIIVRVTGELGNDHLDPGESYSDENRNGIFDEPDLELGSITSIPETRVAITRDRACYLAFRSGTQGI